MRNTKYITFHVSREEHKTLTKLAKSLKIGIGQMISAIVCNYLEGKQKLLEFSKMETEENLKNLSPEEVNWFNQNLRPMLNEKPEPGNYDG